MGRDDGPVAQADASDRTVITVVRTSASGRRHHRRLAWQWVSRYKIDGLLYGELDAADRFTGHNITFIYPDFVTGLHGTFENGRLVSGVAVRLTARRCRGGLMEIRVKPPPASFSTRRDHLLPWRAESFPGEFLAANARRMDPFERRSVYAGPSLVPGANEGIFAKRAFLPGDLVSYFVGVITVEDSFLFDNLTTEEYEEARSYYFNLGSHTPTAWGLTQDSVLDIPRDMRALETFRTTLAHKTNHQERQRDIFWFKGRES